MDKVFIVPPDSAFKMGGGVGENGCMCALSHLAVHFGFTFAGVPDWAGRRLRCKLRDLGVSEYEFDKLWRDNDDNFKISGKLIPEIPPRELFIAWLRKNLGKYEVKNVKT